MLSFALCALLSLPAEADVGRPCPGPNCPVPVPPTIPSTPVSKPVPAPAQQVPAEHMPIYVVVVLVLLLFLLIVIFYRKNSMLLVLLLSLLTCNWSYADSQVGDRSSPDRSEELQLDLPGSEHMKNVGGRDGSGLCVFTSIEHAGRWANVESLLGFQQKMRQELGGGWPEKVDTMLKKYAPTVKYLQYHGGETGLLKLALRTGRMPAVTYGYSPRYGSRIAHMVNLVHLSEKWACVLDNNFPGDDKYEWMPPAEFVKRWTLGGGGWAVIVLAPPPPPVPVHAHAFPGPAFS